MVGQDAYARARRSGLKEYHARMQRRESPFLPVLEEIEERLNALSHVPLGLLQIPLSKVVGTASKGRTNAFAANFMPILDPGCEFATKWGVLYEGIVEQGLNQPVKVLEYLNRYYLVEGNKRVSVMKFLSSVSIEAEVTRVMPRRTDDPENVMYFEFLPFYNDTQINYLWFSKPGSYAKLYELTGKKPGERWTSEERSDFLAAYMRFRNEYKTREAASDRGKLPATTGDAFLIYLEACGYADAPKKFEPQLRSEVKALWGEFEKDKEAENVALIMKPDELKQNSKGSSLLNTLFGPNSVKVAFMYTRQPSQSGWTYWHDLGRVNLENAMGNRVKTTVCVCEDPATYESELERLIAEGNDLIFTTSPVLLSASMKASVKHPGARILNCSLLVAAGALLLPAHLRGQVPDRHDRRGADRKRPGGLHRGLSHRRRGRQHQRLRPRRADGQPPGEGQAGLVHPQGLRPGESLRRREGGDHIQPRRRRAQPSRRGIRPVRPAGRQEGQHRHTGAGLEPHL